MKSILPAILSIFALVGCSIRNSGVRGSPVSPSCSPKTSGLLLTGETNGGNSNGDPVAGKTAAANLSSGTVPWVGGVISYKYVVVPETENWDSPELGKDTCSALFEFSRGTQSDYRVKIFSSDYCTDFLPKAENVDLSVWRPATEKSSAGYIKLKLKNDKFAQVKEAIKASPKDVEPEKPIALRVSDYAFSTLLVPWIQRDIGLVLPAVASVTAESSLPYFCGQPINPSDGTTWKNDKPVPGKCIWPHGVGIGEYFVEAVSDSSTNADIDALVSQTQAFRAQRDAAAPLSTEAMNSVRTYQEEYGNLTVLSTKWQQWGWLRRIFSGQAQECNVTPETRVACLRVATRYFIPEEKAFAELMIAKGLIMWPNNTPPADYVDFQKRYETKGKNPYLYALAKVSARWVSLTKLMQKEREGLRLAVNLPEGTESSILALEPIFPPSGSSINPLLKGAKFDFSPNYLTLEFTDASQKVLRRLADTGSMVLFGGYPVLALLNNTPEGSDGNTQIPLPSPKPRGGGEASGSSSNCK